MAFHHGRSLGCALALVIAVCNAPTASGQPPIAPYAALLAAPPAPAVLTVKVPEGTEVRVRFDEQLSSATSAAGDAFSITTDEPFTLANGTVIPAGYRGKGEVSAAEQKGMIGKPGALNLRLDYILIGDARVHLRANKVAEGKSGMRSIMVLTVLFGPLGLLKHGSDVVIAKGQVITAFVDEDTLIAFPVAPPPNDG